MMLSHDLLSSLDSTIEDQETTIRVLEMYLDEWMEKKANNIDPRPKKEKVKKRKVPKISRYTQCTPLAKKTFSSQTESTKLNFTESVTIAIQGKDEEKKTDEFSGMNYAEFISPVYNIERPPSSTSCILPVFEKFRGRESKAVASESSNLLKFTLSGPDSIWKDTPASQSNGNMVMVGEKLQDSFNLLDRLGSGVTGSDLSFADSLKRSESADDILKSDFPALCQRNTSKINSELNGDSAILSAMRLNRPPSKTSSVVNSIPDSSLHSPERKTVAESESSHKKERLIITNFEEQGTAEIKKFVNNFCKAIGVDKSKVRNSESVIINDVTKNRALKITFDSVETASAVMALYYDVTAHVHFPFPSPQSRIYYDLTPEERYRVKELQFEANYKNTQLDDGEPNYYVCANDLTLKRKRGLKKAENGNQVNSKSRSIDCLTPLGIVPTVLFNSFNQMAEAPLRGRSEVGLKTLISILKRVDPKKIEGAFVAPVEMLAQIGICASIPKKTFSFLVTKRKGVIFFYDDSEDVACVKANSNNKYALLDEDEDSDEMIDERDDSKLILVNETISGDGEDSKQIVLASIVRRSEGGSFQLVKPDYRSCNMDVWWLEAWLSGRFPSIYLEDSDSSESMDESSCGAQCLGFLDRVLSEIQDALGTSAELHFRLEKKENERVIRLAVTDANAGFSSLLKKF